jgi:hypothetical protein
MSRRLLLPLLLLLLAIPATAVADTVLTIQSSIQGLKDQPQPGPVKVWIGGGDKLRRDEGGDTSYILRIDRGKLYILNHPEKTYSELAVADLLKIASPPAAQLSVKVTATNDTKKVGTWNARKYKVDIKNPMGLHLDTTIWASKDVASYQAYNRLASSLAALQPGAADWARKLETIEGFPVLQEADVEMGGSRFKTREELVSVETLEAPAGAYEIPKGYTAATAQ